MVDPETGWFEIHKIPDKHSARISKTFKVHGWHDTQDQGRSFLMMKMSSRRTFTFAQRLNYQTYSNKNKESTG